MREPKRTPRRREKSTAARSKKIKPRAGKIILGLPVAKPKQTVFRIAVPKGLHASHSDAQIISIVGAIQRKKNTGGRPKDHDTPATIEAEAQRRFKEATTKRPVSKYDTSQRLFLRLTPERRYAKYKSTVSYHEAAIAARLRELTSTHEAVKG